MEIEEAKAKIAEKLQYDDSWSQKLTDDCSPGIYGLQNWEVSISPQNICVDLQNMKFTFRDVEIDFEVRLGSSREEDSIDEQYHRKANGKGKFKCSSDSETEIYDIEIDCDLDLSEDGKTTRI
jgi:hypothetical protein